MHAGPAARSPYHEATARGDHAAIRTPYARRAFALEGHVPTRRLRRRAVSGPIRVELEASRVDSEPRPMVLTAPGDSSAGDALDVLEIDADHRLGSDRAQERGAQVGGDALEDVGRELDEALVGPGDARERPAGTIRQGVQRDGRVLERLALDQPGEQQVALGPQRQLLVEVEVVVARAAAGGSSARSAWPR